MRRNREAFLGSLCLNPQLRPRIELLPVALGAEWEVNRSCVLRSSNVELNVGNGFLDCNSTCKAGESHCENVEATCWRSWLRVLRFLGFRRVSL